MTQDVGENVEQLIGPVVRGLTGGEPGEHFAALRGRHGPQQRDQLLGVGPAGQPEPIVDAELGKAAYQGTGQSLRPGAQRIGEQGRDSRRGPAQQ